MPVSPAYVEALAAGVSAHYAEAERGLLEKIGRALANGIDAPEWAELVLLQVQLVRREAEGLLSQAGQRVAGDLAVALSTAYNRGAAGATVDLAELLKERVPPLTSVPAIEALVTDTLATVTATHPRILRVVGDVFRSVVAEAAGQVLVGSETRRQAAQRALDRFATKGITGFVDKAGRGWDLTAYTEMAVRSATANAAVEGHTRTLLAAGMDLVIVSNSPQECPLCRPWEGKVLSLTGALRIDKAPVVGTLAEARAAGLMHPNCRHSVSAYQHGVTKAPTSTADPEGDAARQKLRYLERQVRAWKRREAVALDDVAATRARARVRAYQAQIRDHVAATSAKRQPQRERIGAAR